jgi:hypothetical protein
MKNSLNRAQKIYFDNFGSVFFMKRNGEYKTYQRYKVPLDIEKRWKLQMEETILKGLGYFNNTDLFSKSLFHLCYFDVSMEKKCDIVKKGISQNDSINEDSWRLFIETQNSLYTKEFQTMLESNVFKEM